MLLSLSIPVKPVRSKSVRSTRGSLSAKRPRLLSPKRDHYLSSLLSFLSSLLSRCRKTSAVKGAIKREKEGRRGREENSSRDGNNFRRERDRAGERERRGTRLSSRFSWQRNSFPSRERDIRREKAKKNKKRGEKAREGEREGREEDFPPPASLATEAISVARRREERELGEQGRAQRREKEREIMREKEERKREKRKMESERERGRERGERGSSSRDGIISVAKGIVERGGEKEENKRGREGGRRERENGRKRGEDAER